MRCQLVNGRIFDGESIHEAGAVLIEGGRIAGVTRDSSADDPLIETVDLGGNLLAPGFVDLQVNGGGGVLFNDQPTIEGLMTMVAAHRRFGTTTMLPTLISDDWSVMANAAAAVVQALAMDLPGIGGIHFEGPYLNIDRRGCHRHSVIRPVDDGALALMTDPRLGAVVATLAPEQVPAEVIARLAEAGVRICAGHSNATAEQIGAAIQIGLCGFTHLFNGMAPLSGRAPGVVGAALDDGETWCGVIADGFHVSAVNLRLALKAKPAGKVMLVTDAMPSVGSDQDSFLLMGERVFARDGLCVLEDGTIAGSDLDMATAVRRIMELTAVPLTEALRMASLYPAQFLGLDRRIGRILPGMAADLVLLDDDLRVLGSWIGGAHMDHRLTVSDPLIPPSGAA